MLVTKTSPISGKDSSMNLDITQEQLLKWQNGELIQNAMPQLSITEREFLISGMTPEEQDLMFGGPDKEDFEDDDDYDIDDLHQDNQDEDHDNSFDWMDESNDRGGTGHGDISHSDADSGL